MKKYSEATPETFAVVFYSKASLKNSSLFDKDMKQKVSTYFEDEKRTSMLLSKELTGDERDILIIKDFDTKKPDHKKYKWMNSIFVGLDKYGVVQASIYADTSSLFKDKGFVFDLAKIAEKATYRYTDTNPNTKSEAVLKTIDICVEKLNASLNKSVELGFNVGRGANTARNLGNRPANHATPTYIANHVNELAKEIGGFTVEILEEKDMKKMKMKLKMKLKIKLH